MSQRVLQSSASATGDEGYDVWVRSFDTMDDGRRRAIAQRVARLDARPLVSVLLPVYNPRHFSCAERSIRSCLKSTRIGSFASPTTRSSNADVLRVLEEYAARDERIRIARRTENGHIVAASNSALALAGGRWVVALDHDDELTEHALAMAVLAAADHPSAGVVYSDEDKIDEDGRRFGPFFKPDFDPLRLLAENYLCHMTMLRRDSVESAGGYREGTDGRQDWDLA